MSNTVAISLRLNTNNAPGLLADIKTGFSGISQAAQKTEAASQSAGIALARVAQVAIGGLGLQVVTQWAQQAGAALFNASAGAERLGTQLAFASATPAKDLAYLRDITARLGLEFTTTANAFAGFSAAAKGTVIEGDGARRVFESISAAMSVMGLSTDQARGAMLAIQQMMSKGVVSAEEFRGQLGERMPVALQAGAKALSVTTAEFSKMLETGQIIASDFLPKFAQALDSLLGNAAENAANRLDASVNKMGNSWEQLKAKLGNAGISQSLASEARALSQVFDSVTDNMQQAGDTGAGAFKQWLVGFGTVFGRSTLGAVAGTSNLFNTAVNSMTGNVFGLNENLSLLPDSLRTNAQVTALLTPRLAEANAQYAALQARLAKAPTNFYIQNELYQLGLYIGKLQEARAEQAKTQRQGAADAELGNGRGSRDRFEAEVAESTKFIQTEQAKSSGQAKDYLERLNQYQQALARGVLTQAQYVKAVSQLAKENYKPSEDQKDAVQRQVATLEFAAAKQKLINQDLLADVKSRVAMQGITEEEGARQVTQLTIAEIQARIKTERSLATANALDPAKATAHANAAKLGAQEVINASNEGLRDLSAITQKRDQAYADALGKLAQTSIEKTQSLTDETRALQAQTGQLQQFGIVIQSVATILAQEEAARLSVATATALQNQQLADQLGLSADQRADLATTITQLTAMQSAAEGIARASAGKDLAQAGLDQANRLKGDQQDDPFKSFGSSLRETFDSASDGLARMVDGMASLVDSGRDFAKEMAVIQALRDSGGADNAATAAKNEQALIAKTERQQITAYTSMARAAKTYFAEGSRGYKNIQAAETALRTYQLAMSAQAMAKDLYAIAAKVSAWVTGDTAIATSAVASAGTQAAASAVAGAASASAGVANQAKGDPYSAFPRMAAMAALMLGLGFAVRGGGASTPTSDAFAAQKANDGSGTILGNNKAQSQSIANSLSELSAIARPELAFTSQMVSLLRNIDGSLSGTTNQLLASGFDAMGNTFEAVSTKRNNIPALGSLFGSKSRSTSLSDTGLSFGSQTVAQAANALQIKQFDVIKTEWAKKGFLGIGNKSGTNYATNFDPLDSGVTQAMQGVLAQLVQTVAAAGKQLGASPDQIAQAQNIDTGLGKISLKDKTGEEIQKTLSAVFSSLGDRMATLIAPAYSGFTRVGEGYLQTLTRVGSGLEEAQYYTERLGLATASLSAVQNKTGDVAAELVRQTLVQSQAAGSGIAKIIETFTGNASELVDAYTGLKSAQAALVSLGQSAQSVTTDLLRGAGGISGLQSGLQAFEDKFLTTQERADAQQTRLIAEFAKVGVAIPATAAGFKALVKTLDTTTAAGQKQLGGLLALSNQFSEMLDVQSEAQKAQGDALQAQQDLTQALQASGKSVSQWLSKLDESALGLSSPADKLSGARGTYLQNLTLAKGSDKEALSSITADAQAYLQAARDSATNQAQYAGVLAQVKSELRALPAVKSYEGQTLDALALINSTLANTLVATISARFSSLDANVDGLLTFGELQAGLAGKATDIEILNLIKAADINADGQISAAEATASAIRQGFASEVATLNSRFTSLDSNINGLLTFDELRAGLSITDDQIKSLISAVDINGDGQISAAEATAAATRLVQQSTDSVAANTAELTTNAYRQLIAMQALQNDGMFAVSSNTARALEYLAGIQYWQERAHYLLTVIASTPTTVINNQSGGGGGLISGLLNLADSAVGGILGALNLNALGGVFDGQGVYSQPTPFRDVGGNLNVMGEAGPEAVMPLRRLGDGALGVRAEMQVVHYGGGSADMGVMVQALQAGFARLEQRLEMLDDNNNAGNASIAHGVNKTAKVLDVVFTGESLKIEPVEATA